MNKIWNFKINCSKLSIKIFKYLSMHIFRVLIYFLNFKIDNIKKFQKIKNHFFRFYNFLYTLILTKDFKLF